MSEYMESVQLGVQWVTHCASTYQRAQAQVTNQQLKYVKGWCFKEGERSITGVMFLHLSE